MIQIILPFYCITILLISRLFILKSCLDFLETLICLKYFATLIYMIKYNIPNI